ncbi:MAG TPA: DUF3000 family protein [Streptosporangiaceae bacterium]|nr:DUF3000 family protein [Streptosporangiaceae bacterium]
MSDTYAQVMKMATSSAGQVFDAAVADFRAGVDEVLAADGGAGHFVFEDVPAPKRLAPFATSVAASVHREPTSAQGEHDTDEAASGRLVLLHDPAGQESWSGVFRLVAYVRADIEPEVAADPLLGEVGWSWLTEALEAPGYAAASGTVTRVITEGYGAKAGEQPVTGFELRASWSPQDEPDLAGHVVAWCACLAAAAGLEPPGTRALAPRRR